MLKLSCVATFKVPASLAPFAPLAPLAPLAPVIYDKLGRRWMKGHPGAQSSAALGEVDRGACTDEMALNSMATTPPPRASFLGLPLEVRRMIYRYLLSAPKN